jgi:hypothetical protein
MEDEHKTQVILDVTGAREGTEAIEMKLHIRMHRV